MGRKTKKKEADTRRPFSLYFFESLRQYKLTFYRFTIQRVRSPALLCLEFFMPVVLLLILVGLGRRFTPNETRGCFYKEQRMPSSGLIPFVQSMVCTLNLDPCLGSDFYIFRPISVSNDFSGILSKMFEKLVTLGKPVDSKKVTLTNQTVIDRSIPVFSFLNAFTNAVNLTATLLDMPVMRDLLQNRTSLNFLVKNSTQLHQTMTSFGVSKTVSSALLNSSVNFFELYRRYIKFGYVNYHHLFCEPKLLSKFVIFQEPTDVSIRRISAALCDLNSSQINRIHSQLISDIDLIRIFKEVSKSVGIFSDKLLSVAFDDFATIAETILNFKVFRPLLMNYKQLETLPQLIRDLGKSMKSFQDVGKIQEVLLPAVIGGIGLVASGFVSSIFKDEIPQEDLDKFLDGVISGFEVILPELVRLQSEQLSFSQFIINPVGVNAFLKLFLHWTPEMIYSLFNSNFKTDQAGYLLHQLSKHPGNLKEIFCISPRLTNLLEPKAGETSSLDEIEKSICALNDSLSLLSFDAEKFAAKLAGRSNNSTSGSLNVTALFGKGYDLAVNLMNLFSKADPLVDKLNQLNFTKITELVFHASMDGQDWSGLINETLFGLQNMLETSTNWRRLRKLFTLLSYLLDSLGAFGQGTIDAMKYFEEFISSSIEEILVDINVLGGNMWLDILSSLFDFDVLVAMSADEHYLVRVVCSDTKLSRFFLYDLKTSQLIKDIFCKSIYTELFTRIHRLLGLHRNPYRITRILDILERRPAPLEDFTNPDHTTINALIYRFGSVMKQLWHPENIEIVNRWLDFSGAIIRTDCPVLTALVDHTVMHSCLERNPIGGAIENQSAVFVLALLAPIFKRSVIGLVDHVEQKLPGLHSEDVGIMFVTLTQFSRHLSSLMQITQFTTALVTSLSLQFTNFSHWESKASTIFRSLVQDDRTAIGKMLGVWIDNFPMFISQIVSKISSPETIARLVVASPNIDTLLCDSSALQGIFVFPTDMPLEEMVGSVCAQNVSVLLREILGMKELPEMLRTWFYEEAAVDDKHLTDLAPVLLNVYRDFEGFSKTEKPWNLQLKFHQSNILKEALLAFQRLSIHSSASWEQWLPFSLKIVSEVDVLLTKGSSTTNDWKIFKHFFNIPRHIFVNLQEKVSLIANHGLKMENILDRDGPVSNFLLQIFKVSPDLLDAYLNAAIDPFLFLDALLRIDFSKEKACESFTQTKVLKFASNDDIIKFEKYFCEMVNDLFESDNFIDYLKEEPIVEGIWKEISVLQTYFSDASKGIPDVALNWTQLGVSLMSVIQAFDQFSKTPPVGFPDWTDSLSTLISNVSQFEISSWTNALTHVLPLMDDLFSKDETFKPVWEVIKKSLLLTEGTISLSNEFLANFQANVWTISSLIVSPHIRGVFKIFEQNPDSLAVFILGILKLLGYPKFLGRFGQNPVGYAKLLCYDRAEFCELMPLPATSNTTCAALQKVWCDLVDYDWSNFHKAALKEIDGIQQIVAFVSGFIHSESDQLRHLNFTHLTRELGDFVKYIEKIVSKPPSFDEKSIDLLELETWKTSWNYFESHLTNLYKSMPVQDLYPLVVFLLIPLDFHLVQETKGQGVWPVINFLNRLFYNLNGYVRSFARKNVTLDTIFEPFPESQKLINLLYSLPYGIEAIMETLLIKPFDLFLSGPFEEVCQPTEEAARHFLWMNPKIEANVTSLWIALCSTNFTVAALEYMWFFGFTQNHHCKEANCFMDSFKDDGQPKPNFTQTILHLIELGDSIADVVISPPKTDRFFERIFWTNKGSWEQLVFRFLSEMKRTVGMEERWVETAQSFDLMLEVIDVELRSKQSNSALQGFWKGFKSVIYAAKVTASIVYGNLKPFDKAHVSFIDDYPLPFFRTIVLALAKFPDVLQTLLEGWIYRLNDILDFIQTIDVLSKADQRTEDVTMREICENSRLFFAIFPVPPGAAVSKSFMQNIICNISSLHPMRILHDLISTPGVRDMIIMIHSFIGVTDITPRDANITAVLKMAWPLSKIVQRFIHNPPNVTLGADFNFWKPSKWESVFHTVYKRLLTVLDNLLNTPLKLFGISVDIFKNELAKLREKGFIQDDETEADFETDVRRFLPAVTDHLRGEKRSFESNILPPLVNRLVRLTDRIPDLVMILLKQSTVSVSSHGDRFNLSVPGFCPTKWAILFNVSDPYLEVFSDITEIFCDNSAFRNELRSFAIEYPPADNNGARALETVLVEFYEASSLAHTNNASSSLNELDHLSFVQKRQLVETIRHALERRLVRRDEPAEECGTLESVLQTLQNVGTTKDDSLLSLLSSLSNSNGTIAKLLHSLEQFPRVIQALLTHWKKVTCIRLDLLPPSLPDTLCDTTSTRNEGTTVYHLLFSENEVVWNTACSQVTELVVPNFIRELSELCRSSQFDTLSDLIIHRVDAIQNDMDAAIFHQLSDANQRPSRSELHHIPKQHDAKLTVSAAALEVVDPIFGGISWFDDLKRYLQLGAVISDFFNSWFQKLDLSSKTFKIVDLFPKEESAFELLDSILGEDLVPEFLAGVFNADSLYKLSLLDAWNGSVCDTLAFAKLFTFPKPINSTFIQSRFCALSSKKDKTIVRQLFDLIDVAPLIREISLWVKGDGVKHLVSADILQWSWDTVSRLFKNLFRVFDFSNVDSGGVDKYLSSLENYIKFIFEPYGNNGGEACEALMEAFIQPTDQIYGIVMSGLNLLEIIAEYSERILSKFSDVGEIFCSAGDLNTTEFISQFDDLELMKIFKLLLKGESGGQWKKLTLRWQQQPFSCVRFTEIMVKLGTQIDKAVTTDFTSKELEWKACVLQSKNAIGDVARAIDQIVTTVTHITNVISMFSGKSGLSTPFFQDEPMFRFALQNFVTVNGKFAKLINLIDDVDGLSIDLASHNVSKEAIQDILQADLNLSTFQNINAAGDVCPDNTTELLVFPDHCQHCSLPLSCGKLVSRILKSINRQRALELISSTAESYHFDENRIISVVSGIDKVVSSIMGLTNNSQLNELGRVLSLVDEFSLAGFQQLLTMMEPIMFGENSPAEIISSISSLMQNFGSRQNDSVYSNFFEDMQKLVESLPSLEIFKQADIFFAPLQILLGPASNFENILLQLNLSSDITRSLLQSKINYARIFLTQNGYLMNPDFIENTFCNHSQFTKVFPSTGNASKLLSTSLCQLETDKAVNFSRLLFNSFNYSALIRGLLTDFSDPQLKFIADAYYSSVAKIPPEFSQLLGDFMQPVDEFLKIAKGKLLKGFKVDPIKGTPPVGKNRIDSFFQMVCGRKIPLIESIGKNPISSVRRGRKKRSVSSSVPLQFSNKSLEELTTMSILGSKDFNDVCLGLYRALMDMSRSGQVIWNYVKPILLGDILYTPDTLIIRQVIKEMNRTFEDFAAIRILSKAFVENKENLTSFTEHVGFLDNITQLLQHPLLGLVLSKLFDVNISDLLVGGAVLQYVNDVPSYLNSLGVILKLLDTTLGCFKVNRFIGYANENDLKEKALKLGVTKSFFGAIVFENHEFRDSPEPVVLPDHVQYKIRMDLDVLGYRKGFIQLQDMVDHGIRQVKISALNVSRQYPGVKGSIRRMARPCYRDVWFRLWLGGILPISMAFVFLVFLSSMIKQLVSDKEFGISSLMNIMGLKPSVNWLAWFTNNLLSAAFINFLITLMIYLGGMVENTNPLLIYVMLLATSFAVGMQSYFFGSLFERASLAILLGAVVFLAEYFPFILLILKIAEVQKASRFFLQISCLCPPSAFGMAFYSMTRLEMQPVGSNFANAHSIIDPMIPISLYEILTLELMFSLLYFLLGWYISNVKPTKFGVSQPWWFPFSLSYWNIGVTANGYSNKSLSSPKVSSEDGLHEPCAKGLKPGIQINDLMRRFGDKVAVNDLNLDIFQDEITVLLGHNSAGKTTTISMLCGLLAPSSGCAYLYGYNVQTEFSRIRKFFGICPQNDALIDFMTVAEHLMFFGSLKTILNDKQMRKRVNCLLHQCDLYHKRNCPVRQLSGGMKRRLSVAMAFIGDSKCIILDEPTSGVDPMARKAIWNLIMRHRLKKTILFTTHFLDEADILSDRIIIMHQGQAKCSGSALFLKRKFGLGYILAIDRLEDEYSEKDSGVFDDSSSSSTKVSTNFIMQYIRQYCPMAVITEEIGSELMVSLSKESAEFQNLMKQLELNKEGLGIRSFGITDTTLEEVFLRITSWIEEGTGFPGIRSLARKRIYSKRDLAGNERPVSEINTGFKNRLQTIKALFLKRFHHYRRSKIYYISQLVLPCLLMALAFLATSNNSEDHQSISMAFNPHLMYPKSVIALKEDRATANSSLASMAAQHYYGVNFCTKRNCTGDTNDTIVGDCYCKDLHAFVCKKPLPSARQSISRHGNVIQDATPYASFDEFVKATHFQFDRVRLGGISVENRDDQPWITGHYFLGMLDRGEFFETQPVFLSEANNVILLTELLRHASSNVSIDEILRHKVTSRSHPISTSGVRIGSFAGASITDVGIALMIQCALSFLAGGSVVFVLSERKQKEKRQQFVYGVTPLLYWSVQVLWDWMIAAIPLGITALIIYASEAEMFTYGDNYLMMLCLIVAYVWAVTPVFYLLSRFFSNPTTCYLVLMMLNMIIGVVSVIAFFTAVVIAMLQPEMIGIRDFINSIFIVFPQFCIGSGVLKIAANFILYRIMRSVGLGSYSSPFSTQIALNNLISMLIFGFVMYTLLLVSEYRLFRSKPLKDTVSLKKLETDVAAERARIISGTAKDDILTAFRLTKVFRSGLSQKMAVNDICFSIRPGECFGLLGTNGAGKTTTFRMITGDTFPGRGMVALDGDCITGNLSNVEKRIGYCPQVDALDSLLTAEELIFCYGRIKGIKEGDLQSTCDAMLQRLGLNSFARQTVNGMSGGTKRKLSTALALLADPMLVLMDEPSTGMDPVTRRLVWENILSVVRDGRSVIFTSHCMEECDFLCTRLAIMVNGELKCIGSPQHLKAKYGEGYTVILKVKKLQYVSQVLSFLHEVFVSCIIREIRYTTIEVNIASDEAPLSTIFAVIEHCKPTLHVEDYSVSQTTLNQVFLGFASGALQKESSSAHHRASLSSPRRPNRVSCSTDSDVVRWNDLNTDWRQFLTTRLPDWFSSDDSGSVEDMVDDGMEHGVVGGGEERVRGQLFNSDDLVTESFPWIFAEEGDRSGN